MTTSAVPPRGKRRVVAGRCIGLGGFSAALALYLVGAGRSYNYDESVTVGFFVATPSLLDPFRRQFFFNNHPLFSFVEHLVWSSGGTTETWMRLLPAAFGASSVGFIGWWSTRRHGVLAGASAAAVLALNPLVIGAAQSVRGYSMLVFCAVVSSLLTVQLLEHGHRRFWCLAYVSVTAAGLAVHLYMGFVLAGQVAFVAAKGLAGESWRALWYLSALLGSLAYLALLDTMAAGSRVQGRVFQPSFPIDLARAVLGEHPLAVASLAAVVAAAVRLSRFRREVVAPVVALGIPLVVLWAVVASYPQIRFFVWLVAGVAACAAAVVARWRLAVVPVAAAVVAMAVVQLNSWPEDQHMLPSAAAVVDGARARGEEVCAVGAEAVAAYTAPPRQIFGDVKGCDVLVLFTTWHESRTTLARASEHLPHGWSLPGTTLRVLSASPGLPGGVDTGLVQTQNAVPH